MSTDGAQKNLQFVENLVIITTNIMIKDLVSRLDLWPPPHPHTTHTLISSSSGSTYICGTSEQVPSLLLSDILCSPGRVGSKVFPLRCSWNIH